MFTENNRRQMGLEVSLVGLGVFDGSGTLGAFGGSGLVWVWVFVKKNMIVVSLCPLVIHQPADQYDFIQSSVILFKLQTFTFLYVWDNLYDQYLVAQ